MTDMKYREVERMLRDSGFEYHSRGKHDIYMNAQGIRIPVPTHRVISVGTVRDILKGIKRAQTYGVTK